MNARRDELGQPRLHLYMSLKKTATNFMTETIQQDPGGMITTTLFAFLLAFLICLLFETCTIPFDFFAAMDALLDMVGVLLEMMRL